jgi:hypothetical protein
MCIIVLKCTYVFVARSSSFINLTSVITLQEKTKMVTDRGSIPESSKIFFLSTMFILVKETT